MPSTIDRAKSAWTFKTEHRDQVVAGRRRRQGADRLVRFATCTRSEPKTASSRGRCRRKATSTPRRRSSTAWPTSPAATRSCAAFASRDGVEVLKISSGAYTGASPAIVDGRAYYRHLRERSARRRSEGEEDRVELQAPRAQLPVLLVSRPSRRSRRRRRARQDGARARPQDRQGRCGRSPTGARVDSSPVVCRRAASTSARTTASSTCSTWRPARACSSSRRAARSPHPPRSRRGRLSSARRTGSCSVWGRDGSRL